MAAASIAGNTRHDATPDASYPNVTLERLAFGSCHSRGALDKRLSRAARTAAAHTPTIWDAIASTVQPQAFLWTGDAIYPPTNVRGDASVHELRKEYRHMLHNHTLGYAPFLRRDGLLTGGVHGTWDDHDYGGNDRGRELTDREARRDAYLEFLGVAQGSARWGRKGVYGSVEFGEHLSAGEGQNRRVKVIFLDTRWHRDRHCIPSVGSHPYVPYGALVGCLTRWITAGFHLPSILSRWTSCSGEGEVLGAEQWAWLEHQLAGSTAAVHVLVSSIQVLTTNPAVESWGHFPAERARLLALCNGVPGLVLLSGDVHHAEISTTAPARHGSAQDARADGPGARAANAGAVVEVTSSGLSHACREPFYGPICRPLLDAFSAHRLAGGDPTDAAAPALFTGRNFGSLELRWSSRSFRVRVHDEAGVAVLSTGRLDMDAVAGLSSEDLGAVARCIDGHFWPVVRRMAPLYITLWLLVLYRVRLFLRTSPLPQNCNTNKVKSA